MRLLTEVEPVQRKLDTDHPKTIEQILLDMDMHDAKAMQNAAAMNQATVYLGLYHFYPPRWYSTTEKLAREQYAYSRWLMGIDDYYLTLIPHTGTTRRPHRQPPPAS